MSAILKRIRELLHIKAPEQSNLSKMTEMEDMTEMGQMTEMDKKEHKSNSMAAMPSEKKMDHM